MEHDMVSTLNLGDREETLIEFLVWENSKFLPRVSRSKSSFGFKSSYTGVVASIGRLMYRISTR